MKVHCDEGVAIHIGPEPCVGPREGVDEASAGEHVGQPLSVCCRDMQTERRWDERQCRKAA